MVRYLFDEAVGWHSFFFKCQQQHGKINSRSLITYTTVPYHRDNKIGPKSACIQRWHLFFFKCKQQQHGKFHSRSLITYTTVPYHRDPRRRYRWAIII